MIKRKKLSLSTTHILMISFLAVILLGSGLLSLPFATSSGTCVSYLDALFTATSATCVTGLVTLPTFSSWSVFGEVVILLLIQIGGIGLITIISAFAIALNKKLRLKDNQLIQDAFNLNTLSGLGNFVKKVIVGTLIVELIGAVLYMFVFIPDFGLKGIWISLFNSVSAFCNAGLDIVAVDSLCAYASNPLTNLVTCLLIVLGGLGYIVWWDFLRVIKYFKKEKFRCFKRFCLHSKIVLASTFALIFVGAVLIFILEYNNPSTLKNFSLYDKIQISFFQSVTTRTAGFATINQSGLTSATSIICILLMFIGGSPAGTAGGIKTVTFSVLLYSVFSTLKNKNETVIFNRSVQMGAIRKSISVFMTSFFICFTSTLLLCIFVGGPFLDTVYEAVSATSTVGLTRDYTALLNTAGKIIIILTMYFGRISPISFAVAFSVKKDSENLIKNPEEEISIG